MANLTPQDIAQYAYNAGFRGQDLIYAVAIALRESAGDTKAYNPENAAGTRPGSGSRGLWQIYGQAHPEYNDDSVYDPAKNAAAAFSVYKAAGNRFTPWSTWNNGSAKSLSMTLGSFPESVLASAAATAQGIAGSVSKIGDNAVTQGVNAALENIKASILGTTASGKAREPADMAAYLGGITLIFLGLIFLFVRSGAAETTVKVIGKAAATAAV